ncbi:DUF4372 domain-containing protein [Flavobacterium piscis]|uniref:DUF4372 domain-containing protein n=1 Tax=Flavobacterium piscis TaxID=1114874 RepID=UPI0038D47707
MANITLFSQIISKLDRSQCNRLVHQKETDTHNKGIQSFKSFIGLRFSLQLCT